MASFRFLVRELQQKRDPIRPWGGVVWNGGNARKSKCKNRVDDGYGLVFFHLPKPWVHDGKIIHHSFYYCKRPLLTFTLLIVLLGRTQKFYLFLFSPKITWWNCSIWQAFFFRWVHWPPHLRTSAIWRFFRRYLTGDFFGKFLILFVPSCEGTLWVEHDWLFQVRAYMF